VAARDRALADLAEQSRLADARLAPERDGVRGARVDVGERPLEVPQLRLPADEGRGGGGHGAQTYRAHGPSWRTLPAWI
jgi:hypothetical protein